MQSLADQLPSNTYVADVHTATALSIVAMIMYLVMSVPIISFFMSKNEHVRDRDGSGFSLDWTERRGLITYMYGASLTYSLMTTLWIVMCRPTRKNIADCYTFLSMVTILSFVGIVFDMALLIVPTIIRLTMFVVVMLTRVGMVYSAGHAEAAISPWFLISSDSSFFSDTSNRGHFFKFSTLHTATRAVYSSYLVFAIVWFFVVFLLSFSLWTGSTPSLIEVQQQRDMQYDMRQWLSLDNDHDSTIDTQQEQQHPSRIFVFVWSGLSCADGWMWNHQHAYTTCIEGDPSQLPYSSAYSFQHGMDSSTQTGFVWNHVLGADPLPHGAPVISWASEYFYMSTTDDMHQTWAHVTSHPASVLTTTTVLHITTLSRETLLSTFNDQLKSWTTQLNNEENVMWIIVSDHSSRADDLYVPLIAGGEWFAQRSIPPMPNATDIYGAIWTQLRATHQATTRDIANTVLSLSGRSLIEGYVSDGIPLWYERMPMRAIRYYVAGHALYTFESAMALGWSMDEIQQNYPTLVPGTILSNTSNIPLAEAESLEERFKQFNNILQIVRNVLLVNSLWLVVLVSMVWRLKTYSLLVWQMFGFGCGTTFGNAPESKAHVELPSAMGGIRFKSEIQSLMRSSLTRAILRCVIPPILFVVASCMIVYGCTGEWSLSVVRLAHWDKAAVIGRVHNHYFDPPSLARLVLSSPLYVQLTLWIVVPVSTFVVYSIAVETLVSCNWFELYSRPADQSGRLFEYLVTVQQVWVSIAVNMIIWIPLSWGTSATPALAPTWFTSRQQLHIMWYSYQLMIGYWVIIANTLWRLDYIMSYIRGLAARMRLARQRAKTEGKLILNHHNSHDRDNIMFMDVYHVKFAACIQDAGR